MIRLLYWLMPVKTPNGWTLALIQEGMEGPQPIVGLVNFEDREELPQIAELLHRYVMKLYTDWDSVVNGMATDPDKPDIPTAPPADIPDVFLKGWNEERESP